MFRRSRYSGPSRKRENMVAGTVSRLALATVEVRGLSLRIGRTGFGEMDERRGRPIGI